MGLKSTVECKEEGVERPFPKLMISDKGLLVLFSKSEVGTVIGTRLGAIHKLGCHNNDWIMGHFKDFKGRIILENE